MVASQFSVDAPDFGAHLQPQLGVEVRQRLVHQHQRRLDDDGAGDRHALLLAAGKLARQFLRVPVELHQRQRRVDRARCRFGFAAHRRPKPMFLRTSCAETARSSGTPCRSRASRAAACRCASRRARCCRRERSSPAMQFSAVDLPQPEGPSSAMNSPRLTVKRHAR
jgi:hypothetical protein